METPDNIGSIIGWIKHDTFVPEALTRWIAAAISISFLQKGTER